MPRFFDRFKERKLVQWALAYFAGAWVVVQLLDAVSEPLALTRNLHRAILVLVGMGFLIALVLAWYHGEKGRQKVSGPELLMVAALLMVAGVAISFLSRNQSQASPDLSFSFVSGEGLPRVAILPCENASPDPEETFRASGLHDEILLKLQKISSLVSIGRTSVLRYAQMHPAPAEVAAELGVDFVGECTVQRSQDRIRVIFQLLEPNGAQVFAEDYNQDLTLRNILEIQIDIAGQVAEALGALVTPEESYRIQESPTADFTAYDYYTLGRARWLTRDPVAMLESVNLYEAAIREDSSFALAYAGLAQTYMLLPSYSIGSEVDVHDLNRRAKEAATAAVELDPDLSEAHAALGNIAALYDWDWGEAERHLTQALTIEPGNAQALAWYAELLISLGRSGEAVEMASRAADIDPHAFNIRTDLAYALWNAGNLTAAENEFREQLLDFPGPGVWANFSFFLREVGRLDEVREWLASEAGAIDGYSAEARAVLLPFLSIWLFENDPDQRQEALAEVQEMMAEVPPASVFYLVYVAILPDLGAMEEGIEAIRAMLAARSPFAYSLNWRHISLGYLEHSEFLAILDQLGIPPPPYPEED